MDRKNPSYMTASAVIGEIRKIREEIEERAVRLAELSRTLYTQARRRDVRRDFERAGDELSNLESTLRTASRDQAGPIQERITQLRQERQVHQDRITTYTVFANNWTRVAGMISQGLQRSRSTDRLLDRLPALPAEAEEIRPPPIQPRQEPRQESSPYEDLIESYGEEPLHADGR